MKALPSPGEVRCLVISTFRQFGVEHNKSVDVNETIRLDAGKCVSRTYRCDSYMAMWLVEVGILQFYDEQGNMLRTVNLFQRYRPVRMAA